MTPAEKKIDISKISVYKYPPQLSEIALNQFRNLQANLEHRKHIAQIYQEELSKEPKIKLFNFDSSPLLGFPILVDRPRKLHKNLLKRRIQLNLEWSKTNILPADINHKRTQYIPNSSKNSESVAKKLIYLPTHIHITPKKAYKVCRQIINEL
jgi:dTDP-4-amino-4,6-dideoxygalactose transaminase